MSECSATHAKQETLVQAMAEGITQLAQQLSQWLLSAEPTLAEVEQQVLQSVKE